jgi:hypothetical protein
MHQHEPEPGVGGVHRDGAGHGVRVVVGVRDDQHQRACRDHVA